ncbi:MAG TPA: hypothetical protein ENK08_10670 [Chloroflexi bacterium]|nr:hypothetical protein [Chloroflexota bacterium]
MSERLTPSDEPEIAVVGFFTVRHRLETAGGTRGEFSFPAFRSAALFRTPEGREWAFRRRRWWGGVYELREGNRVRGTARPFGLLRRGMEILYEGRPYKLQPIRSWGLAWRLSDGGDVPLLEIRPKGPFRRGVRIKVLSSVDLPLVAFAYYLVYTLWRQAAAAH